MNQVGHIISFRASFHAEDYAGFRAGFRGTRFSVSDTPPCARPLRSDLQDVPAPCSQFGVFKSTWSFDRWCHVPGATHQPAPQLTSRLRNSLAITVRDSGRVADGDVSSKCISTQNLDGAEIQCPIRLPHPMGYLALAVPGRLTLIYEHCPYLFFVCIQCDHLIRVFLSL